MPARSYPIDTAFIDRVGRVFVISAEESVSIPSTAGIHDNLGAILRREWLGGEGPVGITLDMVVNVTSGALRCKPVFSNPFGGESIDLLPEKLAVNTSTPGISYLRSGPLDISSFLPRRARDPVWVRLLMQTAGVATCAQATITIFTFGPR